MEDCPRLRPVEVFPIRQEGKTVICLRDPQNLAQPLLISPIVYFVLAHLDGRHSAQDIQEAYSKRFGAFLMSDDMKKIVALLDQHFYLYGERFSRRQEDVARDFRALAARPPAHAGGAYPADAAELNQQFQGYFESPGGPGPLRSAPSRSVPAAVVAPHIDFQRGGPCYTWAYRELAGSPGADLYILLGTSHCGGDNPFTATSKDFETPLGMVETDKKWVGALQESYSGDLFAEEHLHRAEHSLEFQVVFLKFIAEWRAAISGSSRPFKIVPILVSSFHRQLLTDTLPEKEPRIGDFFKAIEELVTKEKREVCFVAGVDLAHVGMQFGDEEPLTPDFLRWVEEEDLKLVERLTALDGPGFFQEVAKDRDRRRICGFSPLYSLIRLAQKSAGRCLKYSQAFTPETGSAVTFTSAVFETKGAISNGPPTERF